MGTKTLMTLEEFDQLSAPEGVSYELDEGELIVMPGPMPRHNIVRDSIARYMGNFVHEHKLGRIFVETEFQLGPETVRIPNVALVPESRMRQVDLDRRMQFASALVVEVVSPSDLAEELTRKVDQYLEAGTHAVWVLYPKAREVHVFQHGGSSVVRGDRATLTHEELLPGFSMTLSSMFE